MTHWKNPDAGRDWGQEEKGTTVVKNPTANAEDSGSIPGLGRSSAEGIEMAMQSDILAWESPWTEESGELQSMGSQKSQT